MAVVVIISLLAFTFSGGVDRMVPVYRLDQALREVSGVIRSARGKSQITNEYSFINVDFSSGQFWMLAPFKEDDGRVNYKTTFQSSLPKDTIFLNVIKGKNSVETSGRSIIAFDPYGETQPFIINVKLLTRDKIRHLKYGGLGGDIQVVNGEGSESDVFIEESAEKAVSEE